jgi:hypothetical protein
MLLAGLLTLPAPQPVKAQEPLTTGLVGLGAKLLVGDILREFENRAQNVIDRAGQRGELAVAHAGSELQLMIANLKVMLGDLEKKAFENLTEQQRALFHGLNKTLDRVQRMVDEVRPMSELTLLDARRVVERARGLLGEQDFYISSIRGTTLVHQDHEYRITVTGLGLGFPGNEPKCVVQAFLDGNELDPFGSFRQEENNRIEVRIPARVLQPRFQDRDLTLVTFAIRSTINGGIWSKSYEVRVPLLLLPKAAGEIEIEEVVQVKKWSDAKQTKTVILSRRTGGEQEQRVEKWTCADNQKITGVRYECEDPNAGFCYALRRAGSPMKDPYASDADVVDGGRTAVVYRTLGTWPLTCYYHIDYVTEVVAHEKVNKGKVRLTFDEPFEVTLSPQNRDGTFKITGKLFTGQKLLLTSGTGDADKENPLKLVGRERSGDHLKLTFRLNRLP